MAKMLVTLRHASGPAHTVYNALCKSVVVADLKRDVEALNSHLSVRLTEGCAMGNPRLLDSTRLEWEFGFQAVPIFDQLRIAAGR